MAQVLLVAAFNLGLLAPFALNLLQCAKCHLIHSNHPLNGVSIALTDPIFLLTIIIKLI
jgi:hypothetical protein